MTAPTTPAATWLARIYVVRKPSVVDPQGNTIKDALHQLHFDAAQQVRMGKYLEVTVDAADHTAANTLVEQMCLTLLANPVIEQYSFTIEQVQ